MSSSSMGFAQRFASDPQPEIMDLGKLLENLVKHLSISHREDRGGIRGLDRVRITAAHNDLGPHGVDAIVEKSALVYPYWDIEPCRGIFGASLEVSESDLAPPFIAVLVQNATAGALKYRSSITPSHPGCNKPGIVDLV